MLRNGDRDGGGPLICEVNYALLLTYLRTGEGEAEGSYVRAYEVQCHNGLQGIAKRLVQEPTCDCEQGIALYTGD